MKTDKATGCVPWSCPLWLRIAGASDCGLAGELAAAGARWLCSDSVHLGMVMVRTIWLSVSLRSETAPMPESWIFASD